MTSAAALCLVPADGLNLALELCVRHVVTTRNRLQSEVEELANRYNLGECRRDDFPSGRCKKGLAAPLTQSLAGFEGSCFQLRMSARVTLAVALIRRAWRPGARRSRSSMGTGSDICSVVIVFSKGANWHP